MKKATLFRYIFLSLSALVGTQCIAQDDLLDLLGEDEPQAEYARAGFKTTRIINGHSFEMNSPGVLDFKISHRFGRLSSGPNGWFGLDQALIRIGLDYGISDHLNVGFGANNAGSAKYYDGFLKAKLLRQQRGLKNVPISLLYVADMAIRHAKNTNPLLEPYYTMHQFFYTHQIIIGRKFSDGFSLQLMPSMVHRNFVLTKQEKNDVFVIGAGGRLKLTKRVAFNAEYYYVLPNQLDPVRKLKNSLSIGLDIETGGHVFQLHLTNSNAMVENAFMTETTSDWLKGQIHFGFNVSRVFTAHRPKPKE